jgi:hypothetical protein
MKKAYSKPDIVFEDFSLSTSIAAGCEERPSAFAGSTSQPCGVKYAANVYIFTQTMNGCNRKIPEGNVTGNLVDKNNNGLCYHNPTENYNVFMS